jgi:phosphomannomutase
VSENLRATVEAWIADDVDPDAARELRELADRADLEAGDEASSDERIKIARAELADRFSGTLAFGTAGLRGPLRAGQNGMNRTVVRRAAAGVAAWLADNGLRGQRVVVGFDARYGSTVFAADSAAVFAAAGFRALLLPRVLPTPVLAYAVQHLDAAAGVMVTASHNPPQDNGYKVYAADGAQIYPPMDREIEAAIEAVGSSRAIPLDEQAVEVVDESLVDDYVHAVTALVPDGSRDLRIVHSALHGVGSAVIRQVLSTAGFGDVRSVREQEQPDPDFPTVSFPNPEEPGALDLALALARDSDADLVIANDPDADRCALAVRDRAGAWRPLRGDEVGVLLADAMLREGIAGTYATTIVSSSLLGKIAAAHGVGYAETLTGFKWISRAAPDLVYGYEEALGYCVAPHLVRDKDGISAALRCAHLAAELRTQGKTLVDRLDELAAEYGRYATDQVSVRVEDLSRIDELMRRLREQPPRTLLEAEVDSEDLLPDADVLRWRFELGRVVVRPSGTEPKLKAYLEVVEPGGSADAASKRLRRLHDEVASLLSE